MTCENEQDITPEKVLIFSRILGDLKKNVMQVCLLRALLYSIASRSSLLYLESEYQPIVNLLLGATTWLGRGQRVLPPHCRSLPPSLSKGPLHSHISSYVSLVSSSFAPFLLPFPPCLPNAGLCMSSFSFIHSFFPNLFIYLMLLLG